MNSEYASESAAPALIAALDLFRAPDRVGLAQSSPLPEGVVVLLRVAGGDQALIEALASDHAMSVEQIQEACVFFLQSVLFHQDSDHFRVLGAARDADAALLKSHYRWLQKWLHPDRDPDGWSSVYSHRVNMAWDVLKRPERREEYLESLAPEQRMPGPVKALAISPIIIPVDRAPRIRWSAKWVRRLPTVVAALAVLLALGLWSAHRAGQSMLAEGQRRPVPAPALADASSVAPIQEFAEAAEQASVPDSTPVVAPAAPESPATSPSMPQDRAAPRVASETPPAAGPATAPTLPTPSPATPSTPSPVAAVDQAPAPPLVASPSLPRAEPVAATASPPVASVRAETAASATAPAEALPRSTAAAAPPAVAPQAPALGAPSPAVAPAPAAVPSPQPAPAPAVAVRPAIPAVSVEAPPQSAPARPAPVDARVIKPAPVVATVAVPETAPVVPVVAAPVVPPAPVNPPGPPPEQVAEGQRLIRSFSTAYRNGELQQLVVMFRPNARTPAGNLLDLHSRYQTDFAQSTSRSLEFLNVNWQNTERGIEGTGRYEWAMRPRGGGRVRSTGGEFRIVIEFENGRALIARLDQQDVG